MALIRPRINALFTSKVESLITDLSRRHTCIAVFEDKANCPNCKFDPSKNAGSGVYNGTGPEPFDGRVCPVCENVGFVVTERKIQLVANVRMKNEERSDRPVQAGDLREGEAMIKTFARDAVKLQTAKYFLIDDVRYTRDSSIATKTGLLTPVRASIKVKVDD